MKHLFKKSLAYLLIICMVLLPLVSCGQEDVLPNESVTESQTEVETSLFDVPFSEEPGQLSIGGVSIEEYCIVIPENCDMYTEYAAQNLSEYLVSNADITLDTVTDATPETTYELVIGATNREGSVRAAEVTLAEDEYIIMMDDKSVILYGNGYMVGGAAGAFISRRAGLAWRGEDVNITDIPTEPTPTKFEYAEAKNAILLIGDGMGRESVNMTLANGLASFSADDMPVRGDIITQSQSVIDGVEIVTDSAAGGTALATGFKTLNNYVGVDPEGKSLQNIRELAHSTGAKTAVLTTDAISGATPQAFLAHVESRRYTNWLLSNVKKLLASGKVDVAEGDLDDETFLPTSTSTLQSISAHGSSFFAMIEEAHVDKYGHKGEEEGMIHSVKRLDTLVAYCMEFVLFHPDTVLIVTADHETGGITLNQETGVYEHTSLWHTNVDVPIYAMGAGTEYFHGVTLDNTRVATFIASLYTSKSFGDPTYEPQK